MDAEDSVAAVISSSDGDAGGIEIGKESVESGEARGVG